MRESEWKRLFITEILITQMSIVSETPLLYIIWMIMLVTVNQRTCYNLQQVGGGDSDSSIVSEEVDSLSSSVLSGSVSGSIQVPDAVTNDYTSRTSSMKASFNQLDDKILETLLSGGKS